MAKLQMQRIYIYALKKDRKPVLEKLQQFGVIEVNDIIPEDDIFHKMDVSQTRLGFEKNITAAREAVEIIERYVSEKKSLLASFTGKKAVSMEEYQAFRDRYKQTVETANKILSYDKKIAELKAEIMRLQTQSEILVPWTGLDIPLNFSGTKNTRAYIGSLPKEWSLEDIYAGLADYMPVNVEIISSAKEQTCIFVLCHKSNADGVYEALRKMDFTNHGIASNITPTQQQNKISKEIYDKREAVHKAQKAT